MQEALRTFNHEAERIVHSFLGTLDSQPPAALLYHYTNDVGLRGILETGQIWLTDIFSLNDPSELSHGFSHAIKIVGDNAQGGPPEVRFSPGISRLSRCKQGFKGPHTFLFPRSVHEEMT
jgi:hypothetical protein